MERHETNGVRAEGGLCLVHAWELSAVPRHFVLLSLCVLVVVAASLLLVTRGVGMGLALGHVLGRKRDMLVRHLGMATFGMNAEVMRLVKEIVRKKELGRLIKGSSTLALGVPHILKAGIVHHGVNDGRIIDRIIRCYHESIVDSLGVPKGQISRGKHVVGTCLLQSKSISLVVTFYKR